MLKIKKALVCVDLSDYSKMTMEYASSLPSGLVTEFVVLKVVNNRDVEAVKTASIYYPGHFVVEDFLKKTKEDCNQQIDSMIKQYFSSDMTQVKIHIRVGDPFREILSFIEEEIDLVIIGNKGRSNVVGTLFGSVAEKVFRHSPVPVMSIRDRARFSRETDSKGDSL